MKGSWAGLLIGAAGVFGAAVSGAQGTNVVLGPITNEAVYSVLGVEEYFVQTSSAGNGTVSGATNEWVETGSKIEISATPAVFYEFYQWSDGNATTSRQFTVAGPTNLVASFHKQIDPDGVAEDWKALHSITNVLEDDDRDGVLNRDEYFADTDPGNKNECFRFVLAHESSGDHIGFSATSTNCRYNLSRKSNLLAEAWLFMSNFVGTGSAVYLDQSPSEFPSFICGKAVRLNP